MVQIKKNFLKILVNILVSEFSRFSMYFIHVTVRNVQRLEVYFFILQYSLVRCQSDNFYKMAINVLNINMLNKRKPHQHSEASCQRD